MQLRRAVGSLVAGVVAFGLGTVGVTEALDPYVWPSLMLGLPVGVVLGVSTALVVYAGSTYRTERRETGAVSLRTRRWWWATLAAVGAGVVGGGLAVGVLATQAVGLAFALLVGLGVALLAATVGAVLAWYVGGERGGRAGEASG
jgi:hypothetical protein